MTLTFDHTTLGQRVRFGTGRAAEKLAAEVGLLGAKRVMVIAAPAEAALADAVTARICVAVRHDDVAPHVPVGKAEKARTAARDYDIDLPACVGGGSATGLAKAVAFTTGLPIVAVPTTYAGSEATTVWGLTESARKTTGVDARVPARFRGLRCGPHRVAAGGPVDRVRTQRPSALNRFDVGPRADTTNLALASEGIRALAEALPKVKRDPQDLAGREQALYGAYLSAVAFASAGSGLHRKICHVLGGAYNLPHAQTHAVVLPYALAFNAAAAPEAASRKAAAFGTATATDGLDCLRATLEAPRALKEYGLAEEQIPEALKPILPSVPPSNPRPVTEADLDALLRAAQADRLPIS
jgi:maleylacetate reductase